MIFRNPQNWVGISDGQQQFVPQHRTRNIISLSTQCHLRTWFLYSAPATVSVIVSLKWYSFIHPCPIVIVCSITRSLMHMSTKNNGRNAGKLYCVYRKCRYQLASKVLHSEGSQCGTVCHMLCTTIASCWTHLDSTQRHIFSNSSECHPAPLWHSLWF